MENKSKTITAIDIGTTKIVALTGIKNEDGRFEITRFGTAPSSGIKRGVVLNIEQTIHSVKAAIENLNSDNENIFEEVYIGIAGQHIRTVKSRAKLEFEEDTEIEPEHLEQLSENVFNTIIEPGEEILQVIPQNYIVNDKTGVDDPIGMTTSALQVNSHIVIGQKALLNNIKTCLSGIDIKIRSIILEPLASAKAVLTNEEKEMGVVLVDIGGGTTDIAVFKNNTLLHSAVIPIGGNTITNDVKQQFSILEKQAEELKIQYGQAIPDKTQENFVISIEGLKGREEKEFTLKELCLTIQARMEEIIHAVMFQVDSSKFKGELCAGIVVTGGGALLKNLKQLFSFISGYDVRIAYPTEYISGKYSKMINKPQFSTSIGLIMSGHEMEEKISEKLMVKSDKKKKTKDKKNNGKLIDKIKTGFTKLFDEEDDLK